jgi:DNA-binding NtrC family response regulator
MARRPEDTLVTETGTAPAGSDGRLVLILGERRVSSHALAAGASLVLGRDPAATVVLDHPKVSRRHAVVHGDVPVATVEDAGGTNRVRVAGRTLASGERAHLANGTSFQIGPFTVVLLGVPSALGESAEGRAALVVRDASAGALSELVVRVAQSDVSVLVTGETGTGKEVLAQALHQRSGRGGRFVAINCAALSESLLESELFGHERGAFTGAVQAKPGLFETAARGTVFLDEVGDLPASIQPKLLRAIESRQVTRLGGVQPTDLDVRFIAATHRDLRTAVVRGQFRQDLYFRLNGITLSLLPLRDRRDTIPLLVQEFLDAAAARTRRPPPRVTANAFAALLRHDWPGNVRELKAVVERALLLTAGDELDTRQIVIDPPMVASAPLDAAASADDDASPGDDAERERIVAALDACAGNQTRAAAKLGWSRATLSHKLALLRIPRPRKR